MIPDEHHGPVAELLDRLGADAVAETGEAPAIAPRRRSNTTPWVVAATLVLLAGIGTAVFVLARQTSDHVVADRTDDTAAELRPAPPETEPADITVEFRRDPDRRELAFVGTVTNHAAEPWSWDCLQGTLSRWDGDEWTVVAPSAIWGSELLGLSETAGALDCGPPADYLEPGATEERAMQPMWLGSITGPGNRPLTTPGAYRLVTEGPDDIVAVGRFTIEQGSAASSATAVPPASTPDQTESPDQTANSDCSLISADELVPHLGGVVTFQPGSDAGGITLASCAASSDSTSLTYRLLSAEEYHHALQGSNIDPSLFIGERPVDGADDSVMALFPETGRTSAAVTGMILVGENALVFDLRGGDGATLSAVAVELGPTLAHRLRDHHD